MNVVEIDPLRDLPRPGTTIGRRFRLSRVLGQGGMGAVFLAHDARLERDVALKILAPALAGSHELVTRFVNEARMLARLDCPHVVRVLDAGLTDEPEGYPLPYMVLELLHGDDLRTHCERGRIDPARVLRFMLEACEGLAAAHAEGMIHRDLKPENLFLCSMPDGTEVIKLLDFGVARSLAAPSLLTLSGTGVGSPGYMSPEQLRDATAADERSDIWSLGVVMYELLAGTPPFASNSGFELCAMILSGSRPRFATLCPSVPLGLAAIVERCLAVEPAERFVTVLDLAEALAEFCPASGVETARRIRHRLLVRGLVGAVAPAESAIDVQAATQPAILDAPESTTARPLRRQRYARGLAFASLAAVLALLARAYGPAGPNAASTWAAAEASVTQAGERVSAVAHDLLSNHQKGSDP